jgi:hypothetical protein
MDSSCSTYTHGLIKAEPKKAFIPLILKSSMPWPTPNRRAPATNCEPGGKGGLEPKADKTPDADTSAEVA